MINKSTIAFIFATAFVAFSTAADAGQLPIETADITLLSANVGGSMLVRACASCETLHLQIDDHTQALHNGKRVKLKFIPEHSTMPVTVIYDTDKKSVVKVIW